MHTAAEALAGGVAGIGRSYSLRGRLTGVRRLRTWRKGFSLVRGRFEDASGSLDVIWFNQPYLAERIDPAAEYLLFGALREGKDGLELLNPSCERMEGEESPALHGGRIVPVYPAAGTLGPAFFRRLIGELLAELDLPRQVPERVPEDLLDRHGLPRLGEALQALHAPAGDLDPAAVEALSARRSPAHLRLVYEELLELQVRLALQRAREVKTPRTIRYQVDGRLRQVARSVLPFKLTGAQKRALREIVDDLQGPYPMLRLLQGDVGSGKTLVAALVLVVALENGYQGAFMAPTEILAEQHYANLERLLGGRYRLGLFTGGTADADLRRRLAAGEIQLAVGTHALIQEGVAIPRLGLAVVDEQHRFGVSQRVSLKDKASGVDPDLLIMTATPIPRTLSMTLYGDLDVSTIDELPPGRTPIETIFVPWAEQGRAWRLVEEQVAAGRQAFVVCPLVEDSDKIEAASASAEFDRLTGVFDDVRLGLIHGQLPPADKEAVMAAFRAGEIDVLVSTTVIEVGIDVPNATVMVIEDADRFGLSQLHQLRGRVGRGRHPGTCILIADPSTPEGEERMAAMVRTTDGFELAQVDLELRGQGTVFDTRQSGMADLRLADILRDRDLLEVARREAFSLVEADPELQGHPDLAEEVETLLGADMDRFFAEVRG